LLQSSSECRQKRRPIWVSLQIKITIKKKKRWTRSLKFHWPKNNNNEIEWSVVHC
jgi:hypothetical protein